MWYIRTDIASFWVLFPDKACVITANNTYNKQGFLLVCIFDDPKKWTVCDFHPVSLIAHNIPFLKLHTQHHIWLVNSITTNLSYKNDLCFIAYSNKL